MDEARVHQRLIAARACILPSTFLKECADIDVVGHPTYVFFFFVFPLNKVIMFLNRYLGTTICLLIDRKASDLDVRVRGLRCALIAARSTRTNARSSLCFKRFEKSFHK